MRRFISSLAAFGLLSGTLGAAVLPVGAAQAQEKSQQNRSQPPRRQSERRDQESARAELRAGRQMESREIERRVIPQMRGHEYIGFDFDGAAQVYRLKFMDAGKMVWVDVDAQTARILRIRR